jgi:hypothetical protein
MAITPFIPPSFLTSLPSGIWSGADGLPVLPFLPGQDIAVSKAPQWSTGVIRTASGRERRTAYWSFPLWKFELSHGVIRHRPSQAELAAMWEFFSVMQGQFGPWLFVDPTDCQLPTSLILDSSGQPITDSSGAFITDGSSAPASYAFATGDGATTTFQLTRQINSFAEPVYSVFEPVIFDNGGLAAAHTVASGKVTFSVAPAAGHVLSWFGYFYFGCRFVQDDLTFEQIVRQLWSGKSLKFTSLRV